jgi:hypothetical protein
VDVGIGTAILIVGLLGLFAIAPKRMLTITAVLAGLAVVGLCFVATPNSPIGLLLRGHWG